MKIKAARIQNFRGFEDVSLTLDQHVVLLGENNAGKSTILDAVRRPLDPDPPFQDLDEFDFFAREWQRRVIEIEVTLGDLGPELEKRFHEHWECWDKAANALIAEADDSAIFERPGVGKVVRLGYRARWDTSEERFVDQRYYPASPGADDWDAAERVRAQDRRLIPFFFVPFPRDPRRLMDLTRRSALSRLLDAKDVNVEPQVILVRDQVRALGAVLEQNAGFRDVMRDLVDRLRDLVGLDQKEPLRLQPLAESHVDLLRAFQAVVRLADDPTPLPLGSHGGGLRNAAAAAALLCLAATASEFIVAFEEPEISLHPALQRHLIASLRQLAAQVIVTTHAATVVEKFAVGEVRLVRGGRPRSVLTPVFPSVEVKHAAEHWFEAYVPALFARAAVVVEGMMDEAAFRAYAEQRAASGFDAANWAILEGSGDLTPAFVRGLVPFEIPLVVVLDGDKKGDDFAQALRDEPVWIIQLPKGMDLEAAVLHDADERVLRAFMAGAVAEGYAEAAPDPGAMSIAELSAAARTIFSRKKHKSRAARLHQLLAQAYGQCPPLMERTLATILSARPGVRHHEQLTP